MSASRVWSSAMRCGSLAVSASANRRVRSLSAASTILSRLSGPSGASCVNRPTLARGGIVMVPRSGTISPAITRNSVVLPTPLRPTSPARARSGMRAEAPSSRRRSPMRIAISSSVNTRAIWLTSRADAIPPAGCCGLPWARTSSHRLIHCEFWRTVMVRVASTELFPTPFGGGSPSPVRAETQPARAYRSLASRQLVDLTHSFSPDSPVWSGFGPAKMPPAADPQTRVSYTIAKDGFRGTFYEMVGQYGTHVDPPAHFAAEGVTMDRISLKQMILPLVVFDSTPLIAKDVNHAFSLAALRAWERAHGRVRKGAFAALRTDMSKDWDNPERFKRSPFPAWSLETVKFLVEQRGVTAIGHESLDTDTTDKMESET